MLFPTLLTLSTVFISSALASYSTRVPYFDIPCQPDKLSAYKVILHTFWTRDRFPKHFPEWRPPAQWSKLIGRSHSHDFVLFRLGAEASPGLRTFAESGKADALQEDSQGRYGLFDIFSAPPIASGAGRTESQFFVDGNHSRVSLMSHMIPSPDWFIGIDSFNLCVDGNWLDSITIEVDPLDAGTDNGFTFTAPNWATEPQGVIYRITSRYPAHPAGSFYYPYLKRLPPIATFQFIKLREYELNEIFHHSEDDKKYDVIGIEDQHMSQHNSIPVLNNNDIAEEIEEQRHEVELQMLNQSPKVLITTHSIAPTVETSHVLAPGVVRKGAKDVLLNSIVDSYHRHDEVPNMELVPKIGPFRSEGEVPNLGHHRNDGEGQFPYGHHRNEGEYPAYISSGSLATNNIDSIDRLIKYSNSRAVKKHPKKMKPPRDCKVSDWGPWSPCNSSCGIGEMTRRRSINKHPRRGGQSCPPLLETKWCGGGKDCEQNKTKNSKPNEW